MVTSSSIAVPQLHRLGRAKVAAGASVRTVAALVGENLPVLRVSGRLVGSVALGDPRHAGMGPDRSRHSLRALAPVVAGSDAACWIAQFLLAPPLNDLVGLGVIGSDKFGQASPVLAVHAVTADDGAEALGLAVGQRDHQFAVAVNDRASQTDAVLSVCARIALLALDRLDLGHGLRNV